MKKLTLLFSLMALFAVSNMQAQKACCASKSKTAAADCSKDSKAASTSASTSADYEMVAAKLASLDENIERKVCAETGSVSYVKKETCEKSGKVSTVNVAYDAEVGQFVNVSPSAQHAEKANCSSTKTASAKGASDKACCKEGEKADCCAKGKKASSTSAVEKTKVKLVKTASGTN
jgi:hypothetical protein